MDQGFPLSRARARAAAAAVVALLLVVALCARWARVRPQALAGYWEARRAGALYEVIPDPRGRTFTVMTSKGRVPGTLRGRRGVSVGAGAGARRGRVALAGRRIDWKDGDVWSLQGVRRAPN